MRKSILAALLAVASTAGAVKVQPGPFTIVQRDGTTLTLRPFGDQDLSYFVASDGTLVCQEGTDYFVATVAADGTLAPSALLAHEPSLRNAAEWQIAKAQNRQGFFASIDRQLQTNRARREPLEQNTTYLPSTGEQRIPVILVEFSDSTFSLANPYATFNKYLNASDLFDKSVDPDIDNNYGSVARYFSDMSFGKFTPKFDLYGPVNVGKPLKFYGAGSSSSEKMDSLLVDACKAVDDTVDFAQYDANGDGNIDLIYIIYAGYAQSMSGNSTDCIWPKSGNVKVSQLFDGKKIVRYGVNNELNGNPSNQKTRWRTNGIGLFCHEFSHCMGMPDLYPTSGSTASMLINHEMEYWSLMDAGEYTNNGYRPTELTAWEREAFGWLTIDTLSAATDVTLAPLSAGGKAYRMVNDANESEYYVLENVQQTGWNGKAFGHGLMVTHVDYDASMFTLYGNRVNSTAYHPRMRLIPADGMSVPEYWRGEVVTESSDANVKQWNADLIEKYGGQTFTNQMYTAELAGDLYPGTAGTTSLTDTSSPVSAWVYTGSMGKPLTDIAEDTANGTVTFKFMGGTPSAIANIHAANDAKGKVYSLQGVRIDTGKAGLAKGIYIIDGKKTVIK